jgi:hypothetical protein
MQLARRHALAPLLYHTLRGLPGQAGFPAGAMGALHELYRDNALRNMAIYGQLHKVLATLDDLEIPAIVLKGAYLAQAIYRDLALRQMNDIDILVNGNHLDKVEQVMNKLGYRVAPIHKDRKYLLNDHFHLLFVSSEDRIPLEIHWRLMRPNNPFSIDTVETWEKARQVSLAGSLAWGLSPEHLVLHICLHVSYQHKFDFFALRSLCDLAEISRHFCNKINWGRVRETSRQWGIDRSIYLTLRMAGELLGAAIPDEFLQHLRPVDFDPRFPRWVVEQGFAQGTMEGNNQPGDRLSDQFRKVLFSESFPKKLSAIPQALFPPRRQMTYWYSLHPNSPLFILYYPVRIAGFLGRMGYKFWLYLIGDRAMRSWMEREKKWNQVVEWMASPGEIWRFSQAEEHQLTKDSFCEGYDERSLV